MKENPISFSSYSEIQESMESNAAALKPDSLTHSTVTEVNAFMEPFIELEKVEVPDLDFVPIKSIRTDSASKH